MRNFFCAGSVPNRVPSTESEGLREVALDESRPMYTGKRGMMQGEKNDRMPAVKTLIMKISVNSSKSNTPRWIAVYVHD